MAAALGIVLDW